MNDVAPRLQVKVSGAPAPKLSPAAIGGNAVAQSRAELKEGARLKERCTSVAAVRNFGGPYTPKPSAATIGVKRTDARDRATRYTQTLRLGHLALQTLSFILDQLFNFSDNKLSTFYNFSTFLGTKIQLLNFSTSA